MLKNGKLLYRNDGVPQSEQGRLPASATTPLTDIADVESKDTTLVADPQAAAPEIPRLKNGAPDYNAMPAEMLAVELSGALGHDRAIERLVVSRDAKAKEAEKVRRALETTGDLNKAMAVEERLAAMEAEEARLKAAPGGEEDVLFSIADARKGAPEGVDAERYEAIVDQLRRAVGADHVVTDPAAVRAKYAELVARDETERARQVEAVNVRFNEQLERLTPENADSTILDVGAPSPVMLAVGMPDRPLRLYGNKLLKKAEKHGYELSDVRNLPQAVEHPIAIFKGRNNGSFAVLTELNIGNRPILVTIGINKDRVNDINPITSVYGKRVAGIAQWIENGKLLYADKERTLDVLGLSAPIADALNGQEFNPIANIGEDLENSNIEAKKKVLDYLIPPAPMAGDPDNAGLSSEKIVDRTGPSAPIADAALDRRSSAAKVVTNFENPKIEPENKPSEGLAYFRTKQGEVYGFTVDGTIYLDGERMNAEAPMHEYTELWSQIVERENPRWWGRAKEIMQNDSGRLGEIWNEVNDDRNYRDLSEDLRASETLSRASAEWFARQQAGIKENEGLFAALRRVVREFWRKLKSALTGTWSDDALRRCARTT